jgi:hypothetical protein
MTVNVEGKDTCGSLSGGYEVEGGNRRAYET